MKEKDGTTNGKDLEADSLSPELLANAKTNVAKMRAEKTDGQMFEPRKGQLLTEWLDDANRYNAGAGIEVENYEINSGNRMPWMTDQAYSFIRHIVIAFRIPTRRFGSLLQCFAVPCYFYGR